MKQRHLFLLCALLLGLWGCQRMDPCTTEPLLQGEALRFLTLSPAQVQSWMGQAELNDGDSANLVRNEAAFHAWAEVEAPDLVGTIDFQTEMITLSGMANAACTECTQIEARYEPSLGHIDIVLRPFTDQRCLDDLETIEHRPNGLLVLRRSTFEVTQLRTEVDNERH